MQSPELSSGNEVILEYMRRYLWDEQVGSRDQKSYQEMRVDI